MAQFPDPAGPTRANWLALPPEPWKNGGGVTRTLAVDDAIPGRTPRWRVSVADIERDGPYSCFPGYDRVSVVMSGDGVDLLGDGIEVALLPGIATAFAGDVAFQSRLRGGAVRVLNLFVLRGAVQASVVCAGSVQQALAAGSAPDAATQTVRVMLALAPGHLAGGAGDARVMLAPGDFVIDPACRGTARNAFVLTQPPAQYALGAVLLDLRFAPDETSVHPTPRTPAQGRGVR
ncbi:HutD family protein [Achromobacter seleniivolatilans]|uniref:HutD family protein n=1 Tax=Achromobacter seleniivolatilans TaxID=3047478 RepID=A0ABY9M6W5_9BURK|nr:HutD family protein [Achromobacter sp. R39]WMD22748.1 HutD family protein [Achromobacter sp. R39]